MTEPTSAHNADDPLLSWLLEGDPSIAWQVQADLLDAPAEEVARTRARVLVEGWGRELFSHRADDGQWADGACFPGTAAFAAATARAREQGTEPPPFPTFESEETGEQPAIATYPVLLELVQLGAEPQSPQMQETAELVQQNCRWEYDGLPFFAGEVDCCINAGTIVIGSYLGLDVAPVVDRLVADQMPDGGWNCWAEQRPAPGSFASTLDVVTALLAWERATGADDGRVANARAAGEEYLLSRRLFRSLRTGEPVNPDWLQFSYPPRWHYDILKACDYFARRGGAPDPRLAEAVEAVREKRQPDGRWLLENSHPGATYLRYEDDGQPSRWNTLRAVRVLRWFDQDHPAAGPVGPTG